MKIDGFIGNLDINMSSMPDILSKLAIGDIVRAKVLNFTANDLILKLFDGTTISANSLTSLDIAQGEVVDFVVKNIINNKLVLETVKEKDSGQNALKDSELSIKKQLIELDIKPDSKNMEIAKEIKQRDLPLNKEVFGKIADAIVAFKNFTPQKAAFLVANNIIPEEKSIAQLNKIVDEKQQLSSMVKDVQDALLLIKDKDIVSSINHALKNFKTQNSLKEPMVTGNDIEGKDLIKSTIEKAFAELGIVKPEMDDAGLNKALIKDATGIDKALMNNEITEKLTEFIHENIKKDTGIAAKPFGSNKLLAEKAITFLKDNLQGFEKSKFNDVEFVRNILKNTFEKMGENQRKLNISSKGKNLVEEKPIERSRVEKELKEVFKSFHLKIAENTSGMDLQVKKVYKEMYERLEIIRSVIEQKNPENKEAILQKLDNLQSSLKFINELNNHSSYIQIPMNVFDRNTTGELYVLKKGSKRKKIDPENTSVLVSLNTENLGQIDTLLNINKKNISLNLRVEDEWIIGFLKENYVQLYNSLKNKGYKLVDVKYRLIEEKLNPLNADRLIKKELDKNKQSIDFKI